MNSENPDQPAGPCSMIRAFTVHVKNLWLLCLAVKNVLVYSEGPDQPAGPCSIIRAFTLRVKSFCVL